MERRLRRMLSPRPETSESRRLHVWYAILPRMDARHKCTLQIFRGVDHTQQILTGYLLLHRAGQLDLRVETLPVRPESWSFIINVEIAGRRIAYDLQDDPFSVLERACAEYLDGLDSFFVRSHLPGTYGVWEERVHPLGLNYPVSALHPTALWCSFRALRDLPRKFASANGRPRTMGFYEQAPHPARTRNVLFFTRVWDPQGGFLEREHPPGEVHTINERRVECIRALRSAFKDNFIGGIAATPYAVKHYSAYIAPRRLTNKSSYFRSLRSAAVCVTTEGLGHSNGWKLTEYVAASKAIVTEPLRYNVPGDFADGVNYYSFSDAEQCVAAVQKYLDNPDRVTESSRANWKYYNGWVRPDAMVRHTINTALS